MSYQTAELGFSADQEAEGLQQTRRLSPAQRRSGVLQIGVRRSLYRVTRTAYLSWLAAPAVESSSLWTLEDHFDVPKSWQ